MRLIKTLGLVALLACGVACTAAPPGGGGGDDATSDVVARIGDREFTLDEVDQKARATSVKPYQALYDARRQALDELMSDHLLEQEAASRGIDKAELIRTEVNQRVNVTDADIEAFFNNNQPRMGGRTLEQMQAQIRSYLLTQGTSEARTSFLDQLKDKTATTVYLDPPRVEMLLAQNDPAIGPPDAPVTVVEYSDFQ